MNSKKKNKKANKPPNPNPPQNVPKPAENVEEIQSKCEVKEEPILQSEICSEVVVTTPVSDVKEVESETPKKPKRNKGKKKKQDKDEDFVDNEQEKQIIQSEVIAPAEESVQKLETEDKDTKETTDSLHEENVAPSARKKKNKKKSQEKQKEESHTPDQVSQPVPAPEENLPKVKIEPEIQEIVSLISDAPKQENKKKKNKKKNRTDSERSDKSDNVVSCTSAFQKLLVEDVTSKQDILHIVSDENKKVIESSPSEIKTENSEHLAKNVESKPVDAKQESTEGELKDNKEIPKEDSKGKKKNKKDKKQPQPAQKETVESPKLGVPHESISKGDVVTHDDPKQILLKQDIKETTEVSSDPQKQSESSPKPKAKIAKPVEKKRKGEDDFQSLGNQSDIEKSEVTKADKLSELPKVSELKLEETSAVDIAQLQVSDQTIQKPSDIPKTIECIDVPSDSTIGKKRKKSPKPQKAQKSPNLLGNIKSQADEIKECTVSQVTQPESQIINPEKIELITVEAPKEIIESQEHQKIDLPEKKIIGLSVTSEMKTDDDGFETKTNKKKKKTPKIPQIGITPETKEPEVALPKKEDVQEKPKDLIEEKMDFPLDLSTDLEIRSVRTESETSSIDAVPDVLFIRSSSQHLLDSNNNTVIQELVFPDDIKLNEPLQIPLVEGSGETPIRTPELVTSGIRTADIEGKTPIEEKTDIKSKMMEVNQDMEELRMSIERSLAEFTALEKCQQAPEIKLESKPVLEKEKLPPIQQKFESEGLLVKKKSPQKETTSESSVIKEGKDKTKKVEDPLFVTSPKEMISEIIGAKEPEKLSPVPTTELTQAIEAPPVCPARKDNKSKSKSKKKGKQETSTVTSTVPSDTTTTQSKESAKDEKQEKSESKSEQKTESTQEKGKQQSLSADVSNDKDEFKDTESGKPMDMDIINDKTEQSDFDPIENFEDALTSSIDDVNITFEMIAKDVDDDNIEFQKKLAANKPEINITEASDDTDTNRQEKINPVSQPKNLLGQIDFPVQSNKTDYKKEKNKTPNARQARVKIRDSADVEGKKKCKESQTENKRARKNSDKSAKESFSKVKSENEEYIYKYSFRKVFLQSACHVCNKDLSQVRVPCGFCSLVFYCSAKHKDEDWPQHQALCFAVSTLAHMKDQKHIYADAQNATGQDYRLLRMQMIVSCEKMLKRRLVPWEQEAMLYPRICADVACREWRQTKLKDCDGCGQLSYCAANPDHLPKSHHRWCKSYSLYQKLVTYQQTKGRLEPRLPTRVLRDSVMPGKINEVLAAMYEEKIDMNDIQYASLTQLATAPLTTAYCLQLYRNMAGGTNGIHKKQTFTIHVVGAELQFEADALNKWEVFFLHHRPDVQELRVVLVSPMLNPGNLPLDILGRVKICDSCLQDNRRIMFKFEDNKNYSEYRCSEDFIYPDIICAFNPSIQRASIYNGKDPWPSSINSILKLKKPFIITSYTLNELRKDIARVKQVAEIDFKLVSEAGFNNFASVRPDRNFISDDEMPLLFKNYCVAVLLGC